MNESHFCMPLRNLLFQVLAPFNGRVVNKLKRVLAGTEAFIDRNVSISSFQNFKAGAGAALYHGCFIQNPHGRFSLGRQSHLGAYCYVNNVYDSIDIGDFVAIGPGTKILSYSNHYEPGRLVTDTKIRSGVKIGSNVFIGANCVILPGAVIEDDVVVGANSIVKGTLKANQIYAGSLAESCVPIGTIDSHENRIAMSLRTIAIASVKWTSLSALVVAVVQFAQVAILARLLSPSDFGLMAIATVVIGFSQAFSDMGISNAIIHKQDTSRETLSSLYWANILAGLLVWSLLSLAAPLIAAFYHHPQLQNLILLASLTFLITPIGQQFQVLLQKSLHFDQIAKVDTASAVGGAVVSVAAALAHQGAFSLVCGQLAAASIRAVSVACLGWTRWRPAFRFHVEDLRSYIGFGLFQTGERCVNFYSANVDYLLIGRFLGAEVLGIYSLAYQLVVMPLTKLNPIITRVAFPLFAQRQSDHGLLRQGYLEMTRLLALLLVPGLIALGVLAPLILPPLFGPEWTSAAPLVQILALLGIFKGLANPSGTIVLAKGRADIGFKWNLTIAIVNTLVFLAVVPAGIEALSWTYVLLSAVFFVLGQCIVARLIGLNGLDYFKAIATPAAIGVALGGALMLLQVALESLSPLPLKATVLVVCCITLYASLTLVAEKKNISRMRLDLSKGQTR